MHSGYCYFVLVKLERSGLLTTMVVKFKAKVQFSEKFVRLEKLLCLSIQCCNVHICKYVY